MKQAFTIFAFIATAIFGAAANPTPTQEAEFLARVEKAFTTKDASGMLSLYCFDRVKPSLRQQTEKVLIPALFKQEYLAAELVPLPPDQDTPYTLRGVTYAPNLEPLKALIVHFKKSSPAMRNSTTMIVGLKGDSLAFALAAPVSTP